ncbi:germin-like protein subfamily T member 2 [Fagus crenata]
MMKSSNSPFYLLSCIIVLILLPVPSRSADPDLLQDFCIADLNASISVNGFPCKPVSQEDILARKSSGWLRMSAGWFRKKTDWLHMSASWFRRRTDWLRESAGLPCRSASWIHRRTKWLCKSASWLRRRLG